MAQVLQRDKRSGITYAYESTSWWDKEKKQSRAKRVLIGRYDEASGKIVPTDGRCKKTKQANDKLNTENMSTHKSDQHHTELDSQKFCTQNRKNVTQMK